MDMKEKILVIAQRLVRQRGFNGFSYADIADEVGIRKASLHHHFPAKADLGVALLEAYSAQFDSERVRVSASPMKAREQLRAYVNLYRTSLESDCVCMGGMLASESITLDPAMLPGLKRFFERNTEWLVEILAAGVSQKVFVVHGSVTDHARMLVAALQGALMIAHATGDHDAFERTAALLLAGLTRKD